MPRWLLGVLIAWATFQFGLASRLASATLGSNAQKAVAWGGMALDVAFAAGLILVAFRATKLVRRRKLVVRENHSAPAPPSVLKVSGSKGSNTIAIARPCPNCSTNLKPEDTVCFYCRSPLDPWIRRNGFWWRNDHGVDEWLNESTMEWREWEQV